MANSLTPTVRRIVEAVRGGILEGKYQAGRAIPSEGEIATALGVGRGSVRAAIEVLVSSGDLERQKHSRPTVSPLRGRVLTSGQTDIYVWVAQTIRDHTSVPFLQGISHELAGTQYRMVVQEPTFYEESVVQADERRFFSELAHRTNVAGAIVWRDIYADDTDLIGAVIDQGVPLVFVDSPAPGNIAADHVGTANLSSAKQCVKHLIDQGHRRIVCVSDTEVSRALQERVKGYWTAMRQAGLTGVNRGNALAQCIVPPAGSHGDNWQDPLGGVYARYLRRDSFYYDLAHVIVEKILEIDPLPTAIFVTYDILAYWVWGVLEGRGIRVPQQMSIVGFDWRAHWEKDLADELDTAAQDFEGFGRCAVDLLLERVSGDAPPAARHILLEAPLVIRSSTGPAPRA